MTNSNTVLVDEDYLRELMDSDDLLKALMEVGVDNWEGFEEAQMLIADEAIRLEEIANND
jgi:hypothetical protein